MTWRYIAQRATTGELLNLELPFVSREELSWSLSAAGAFRGTVSPDTGTLRADDGDLLLQEYGTLLYAEADGLIRWGGIVVSSKFNGSQYEVEAATFASYPNGIPWLGEYYGAEADPADVIRLIWQHIQSFPDGNLGVVVTGSTTRTVGSASEAAANAATTAYNTAHATYEAEKDKYTSLRATASAAYDAYSKKVSARTAASSALTAAKKTKNASQIAAAQSAYNAAVAAANAQKAVYTQADADADAQAKVRDAAKATSDAKYAAKKAAVAAMKDDGGAYKLLWWEAPDCGQAISSLVSSIPLDFTEKHYWSGTTIKHEIAVQYPRAGRRRTDLAFVQGDNVTDVVQVSIDGDELANNVVGIGAGEGEDALRRATGVRDGRLRRVYVLNSKDAKSSSVLDAQIKTALAQRQAITSIDSISVRDHPNAPIASWELGDDILVTATLPWIGNVSLWHRIVGWSLTSDSTATLKLEPSDSFSYGG